MTSNKNHDRNFSLAFISSFFFIILLSINFTSAFGVACTDLLADPPCTSISGCDWTQACEGTITCDGLKMGGIR